MQVRYQAAQDCRKAPQGAPAAVPLPEYLPQGDRATAACMVMQESRIEAATKTRHAGGSVRTQLGMEKQNGNVQNG